MKQYHKDRSGYPSERADEHDRDSISDAEIENKVARHEKDKTQYGIYDQMRRCFQQIIRGDHSNDRQE